jgi:hypothetical protein
MNAVSTTDTERLAQAIHLAILDYSREGSWPIAGDDFDAADWIARRITSSDALPSWRCPGDPIECPWETRLAAVESLVTHWEDTCRRAADLGEAGEDTVTLSRAALHLRTTIGPRA